MRKLIMISLLAAFSALVGPAEAAPPVAEDDVDDEHVLDLPGLGRIPMPPNVRVYGPRSRERKSATLPPSKPPSEDERRVQAREQLFERLAKAESEDEARAIGASLARDWARSNSDTIDLLSARAQAAAGGGAHEVALALLGHVVALAPYWSEGFVRRAGVKAAAGDEAGALADLETAARLEPRRFDALAALGGLAERLGEKKRALDAYRKSLTISPRQDALRKTEERLRLEVEGRDI